MAQTQVAEQNNGGLPTQDQILAMNQAQQTRGDKGGLFFGVAVPTLGGVGAAYGAQRYLTNRAMEKAAMPDLGNTMLERLSTLQQRDDKTIGWMAKQEAVAQRESFVNEAVAKANREFTKVDMPAIEKAADKAMKGWEQQADRRIRTAIENVGQEYNKILAGFTQRSYTAYPATPKGVKAKFTTGRSLEETKTAFGESVTELKGFLNADVKTINPSTPLEETLQNISNDYHNAHATFNGHLEQMREHATKLVADGRAEEAKNVNVTIKEFEERVAKNLAEREAVFKETAAKHVLENVVGTVDAGKKSLASYLRHPIDSAADRGVMRGAAVKEFAHLSPEQLGGIQEDALKSAERLGMGRVTALVVAGIGGTALVSKAVGKIRDMSRPSNSAVYAAQDMGRVVNAPQQGMSMGMFA